MNGMKQYYDTIYDQREETLKQRKLKQQFEIFRELDKWEDANTQQVSAQKLAQTMLEAQTEMLSEQEDTSAQQVFEQDLASIMLNARAVRLSEQCATVKEVPNTTKVNRKSVAGSTKDWCFFAKPDDEMEACEWGNGEGFDVNVHRNGVDTKFHMTWGEWEMIKHLVEELER